MKRDEWVIDEYSEFIVVWTLFKFHRYKGKYTVTKFGNKDIEMGENWTKGLSDPSTQTFCKFERSLFPTVLEKENSLQVTGRIKCSIGAMKIIMDLVSCVYAPETSEVSDKNKDAFTTIKMDGHIFDFGYGCQVYSKKD